MDFLTILPLAFVMVAGPQIISSFFFATSEDWKRESASYVFGAALSITAVVTVAYLLAGGVENGDEDSGLNAVDWAILALLAFAMVNTFRKRNVSEPPKWMGKLQEASPKMAFVLGFLLLGFFPSDIVTSFTVGGHIGNRGDAWWEVLPFVGLTLLLLASPALAVALLGRRAQTLLPKIRDWMNTNSWIVSEFVIVFFIVIILSG
ncbi:MAG TPA: GAP family protein [Solirubrobacterales bacterium]|nr:GAP family protein [Solirubrobacterales bacterium]